MEYRNTKQRQRLLHILEGTTSHPTAATLYDELRQDFPKISMGTVYRNLSVLEHQGFIQRLDCGTASDRYDATTTPHIHLRCTVCGNLYDVTDSKAHESLQLMIDSLDSNIESYSLMCQGICPGCDNKIN